MGRKRSSKTNPPPPGLYRLGDAAKLANVTTQQLQYYLLGRLIVPTKRSSGNQRLFDERAIKKIRMIRLLNESGYGLREIREIFMNNKK